MELTAEFIWYSVIHQHRN